VAGTGTPCNCEFLVSNNGTDDPQYEESDEEEQGKEGGCAHFGEELTRLR
jgi:hypothetical protein